MPLGLQLTFCLVTFFTMTSITDALAPYKRDGYFVIKMNEREIYKSARPTLGYWPWPAHPAALSALPVTAWLLGYLAGPAWPLACCCVEERC